MRKFIEASLVLVFAMMLTLVIMAVIFPRHVLGGGRPTHQNSKTLPAVFVYGTHEQPGSNGSSMDTRIADQRDSTGCPYLAALAAASKCPATPRRNAGSVCPYMLKMHRQFIEPKNSPAAPPGKHI
jgi:hypothetical protein